MLKAAEHLVETSELLQKEHIEVQDNWLNHVNNTSLSEHNDWEQFVNSSTTNQIDVPYSSDEPIESDNNTKQLTSEPIMDSKNNDDDDDDGWSEVEDRPSGVTDT